MVRGTVGQDGPLLEQRGGQVGTAGLWAGCVAVTLHSVYWLETETQAHSPCAALCQAEEPWLRWHMRRRYLAGGTLLLGRCFLVWFCLGSWVQAGTWLHGGSPGAEAAPWTLPRWLQPGVAGATACPPTLPVFQQPAQGCFHLLGCLCPWRSSERHRTFLAAPGDLQCSALQPRGTMGMERFTGCRLPWSVHPWAGCHCTVPPGILQPYCFCQHWCGPGSIPAGPAPVLSTSWLHCSGRRIFLALWWFSLMLGLTDEANQQTCKQNFHSPWRALAVTHVRGPCGFTGAQEAEVSVELL